MKEYFEIPTNCPICNTILEVEGKFLICPNDNCKGLQIGNLYKWITTLEIKDCGERSVELLHEAGKINEPADFYKLKVSDFMNLEGMGERSGQKILDHLHEKKEITLPEFIGGLNMANFSNSTAETLMEAGFDTIEKMQNATVNEMIKIKGIEDKTARKIEMGLLAKKDIIKNLLQYITIKEVEKVSIDSNKFENQSFCFTGSINKTTPDGIRYTREMMEELVIKNSGIISSVKKGLTFLVQADPSSISSKSQKAKELGITILSEVDFFKMVEN
jgi:DNA ligase (NAD+)